MNASVWRVLEERTRQLDKIIEIERKAEQDLFLKNLVNPRLYSWRYHCGDLRVLIKKIPPHKMLRFKGKDRSILIIKSSRCVIEILDTDQRESNRDNLKKFLSIEEAVIAILEAKAEDTIKFLAGTDVKMELLPIPRDSTFSDYL